MEQGNVNNSFDKSMLDIAFNLARRAGSGTVGPFSFNTLALGDFPTGGAIGTAPATVDAYSSFGIAQTTAGQTLTLPNPTNTTSGRVAFVMNDGTADFLMFGDRVDAGRLAIFEWDSVGATWRSQGQLLKTDTNVVLLGSNAANVTTGAGNTAVGINALAVNTTGTNSTAVGNGALALNTGAGPNTAVGQAALGANTTGTNNVAVGKSSLGANTTGTDSTAVGTSALAVSTATGNTAVGSGALAANTTGAANTAVGQGAATTNTTSANVTALGQLALTLSTGASNTGVGKSAGAAVSTGASNTIVGAAAAPTLTTGSNNIVIGAGADVTAAASAIIAIGNTVSAANATIASAFYVPTTLATQAGAGPATLQFSSANGQIGPMASSLRFKKDVQDLGKALDSTLLFQLRPVTYTLKASGWKEFGFIAEEMHEIFPQIVPLDQQGKPLSINYGQLTAVMVEEMKKMRVELDALKAKKS